VVVSSALTTLRFFAATLVLATHVQLGKKIAFLPDFARNLLDSGYPAVTFFFELSGFILVYVYSDRTGAGTLNVCARDFWLARVARIAPAYYLALLIAAPIFIYSALLPMTPFDQIVTSTLLVPSLLQAWLPPIALAWNPPAWSLSAEAFFYASFPLLMRFMQIRPFTFFSFGTLLVIVASFRWLMVDPTDDFSSWHHFMGYFPLFHLPKFMLGMALGHFVLMNKATLRNDTTLLFSIGGAGALIALGFGDSLPWWAGSDAMLCLCFSLVIIGASQSTGWASTLLSAPSFLLLGEASYALYIIHGPLAFWWHQILKYLPVSIPVTLSMFAFMAAAIVASLLTYVYIETPLRKYIARRWASPIIPASGCGPTLPEASRA
jgi:peptidoglycan/LPS O-acetylase OafA/YrhL